MGEPKNSDTSAHPENPPISNDEKREILSDGIKKFLDAVLDEGVGKESYRQSMMEHLLLELEKKKVETQDAIAQTYTRVSDARRVQGENELRKKIGNNVDRIFFWLNIGVFVVLIFIATLDAIFISKQWITPDQRLLTERIVFEIIGGITLQAGVAMVVIVRHLFSAKTSG